MRMRPSHRPAIDWDTIGQELFDRIIEALVQRVYDDSGWAVRPIDGRGGDGGIDVECLQKTSGQRHVFQLKYFPEGFSGKHRKRREQIQRSFDALDSVPDRWILVAPCTTDQSGYAFLKRLVGNSTELELWHRARLDELLAAHRDLADHFAREDYGLEQAKQLARETAVLAGGSADLSERVASLGKTVDAVDENWTFDFTREGDSVVHILRAKHARAAEVAPINISFLVDASSIPDRDQTTLRDMDYGLAGSVTFPGEAVQQFMIDGPELVRREPADGVEVTMTKLPNPNIVGKHVELHLSDERCGPLGVFHGVLVDGRPGAAGMSLRTNFFDIVTITFLMPPLNGHNDEGSASGTCNVQVEYPSLASVDSVRLASEMMVNLAKARRVELRDGTRHLVTIGLDDGVIDPDRYIDQHDLAADLAVVQEAAKNRFPLPIQVSELDRTWARALRLALQEGHTYAPGVTGLHVTFSPDALKDAALQDLLAGEARAFVARQEPFQVELCGHELVLPQMALYHPAMRLRDHEQVTLELARGQAAKFHLETVDGSTMTLLGSAYPAQGVPPAPWGLRGIPEPKPLPDVVKQND